MELIFLYQLVKIHAEQLECDANVIAKGEVFQHVYDIHRVVAVLLFKMFQDANLLLGLTVEAFLVSDHLQGDVLLHLVIIGFDHLAEAALADDLEHLVSVSDVVVRHVQVRSVVVIKSIVVGATNHTLSFLGIRSHKVHMGIVEDLVVLKCAKLVHILFHCRLWH